MTYSVGFRAPEYQELGEAFLQFMADSIELPGRYADPDLAPCKHPAEIGLPMLSQVAAQLNKVRFAEDDITIFLGEYLSEPKASVFFEPPARPLNPARFIQTAAKRGVALSRKTRMLYRGKHVFINGESFAAGRLDKGALCCLADTRRLEGRAIEDATQDVLEALHTWYLDGWLILA
jgi:50S ribosomal protein L16 3-hydroxylase